MPQMKQSKWEQFVSVEKITSMSSGKMPCEFIFPMEFLSLFQDNFAPFALQSVLYVESMKEEFFPPALQTRNFAASVPYHMRSPPFFF